MGDMRLKGLSCFPANVPALFQPFFVKHAFMYHLCGKNISNFPLKCNQVNTSGFNSDHDRDG